MLNGHHDLPDGWTWATLGEVTTVNPRRWLDPPDDEEQLSFIPMAAVEAETGRLDASDIRPWKDVKKGYTTFQTGDVLLAKITPCMENGKFAVACGLRNERGAGSTEFHVLRPNGSATPHYVLHYLLQRSVRRHAKGYMAGAVGQQRVPASVIEEIQLPLPPLPEQHRIVAAIEQHFSRLDAAVAALHRVRISLKRYRASVLKAACEGRLVPTEAEVARAEGRDYEPADVLLGRILTERRAKWEADELAKMQAKGKPPKDDRWKAKYTEPEAPDTRELAEPPAGWEWASVDQLSLLVQYGTSAKTTASQQSGVPVLRMGNIVDGRLDLRDLKYLPSDHPEFPSLLLNSGDVLFNRTNSAELVGKTAVFQGNPGSCSFASYLIRVQVSSGYTPQLLSCYLNSPMGRAWIKTVVSQQVGQANVNGTKLRHLSVPLPPLPEQQRIVAEVERRLSVIEELETTVEHNLKRAERLRQAILKRAFEGKLVPQDPKDEPASVLLERMRAERQQADGRANGKGTGTGKARTRRGAAQLAMPLVGERAT